jgi:hypothetical protein
LAAPWGRAAESLTRSAESGESSCIASSASTITPSEEGRAPPRRREAYEGLAPSHNENDPSDPDEEDLARSLTTGAKPELTGKFRTPTSTLA